MTYLRESRAEALQARAASRPAFEDLNATRIIATIMGVIFGISGMNHGFFEALQGNTPTGGLFIYAIGEAQRFWPLGTEDAFTIVPNFLLTGLLALATGLAIIGWSIWYLPTRHGPTVLLGLFILLFLVGGGIGQVGFFLPTWAFATHMQRPPAGWGRVLPPSMRPLLSRLWPWTHALSVVTILIGLEIAIFGYVPGVTDPETIQNTALLFVLSSALLNVASFIAAYGHDLRRVALRREA
jgi:hypothetical protein